MSGAWLFLVRVVSWSICAAAGASLASMWILFATEQAVIVINRPDVWLHPSLALGAAVGAALAIARKS